MSALPVHVQIIGADSTRAEIEAAITAVRTCQNEAVGDRALVLGEFLDTLLGFWAKAQA